MCCATQKVANPVAVCRGARPRPRLVRHKSFWLIHLHSIEKVERFLTAIRILLSLPRLLSLVLCIFCLPLCLSRSLMLSFKAFHDLRSSGANFVKHRLAAAIELTVRYLAVVQVNYRFEQDILGLVNQCQELRRVVVLPE
jgi:hypothetical protein